MVALGGASLLDEVERSGTRRVQTARAWPRAAQLIKTYLTINKNC